MTQCSSRFFKGDENHWTKAGGQKPLWSRKRSHSWKTPVSREICCSIKGYLLKSGSAVSFTSLPVFLDSRFGQATQLVSSAQMEACTCVLMSLTKSCGMTLCWMSCKFTQQKASAYKHARAAADRFMSVTVSPATDDFATFLMAFSDYRALLTLTKLSLLGLSRTV